MKATLVVAAVGALLTIFLCKTYNPASFSEDRWDSEFMNYVTEYRKSYGSTLDFQARKEIFKSNMIKISEHNMREDKTHTEGVNQFADWTQEEFEAILKTVEPKTRTLTISSKSDAEVGDADIDWRTEGIVAPVKD